MGIGAIIRNSVGKTMTAISKPVCGHFTQIEIEAKALSESLLWAQLIGLPISYIESDALQVVHGLKNSLLVISEFGDLKIDMSHLLSFFS